MTLDAIREMTDARQELAERLRFLDANVWLGRPQGFPLAGELKSEDLGPELASRFVSGALVSHWRGKIVSAQHGNAEVTRALAELGANLFAVWTGLPLHPKESGPVPGAGDLPASVRAVRIFPRSHNFPLESWCIGTLCEWLVERGLPLLVWHVELYWSALHRLAAAFPKLSVVVEAQTQKILYHTRPLFALMRERPNVHVELSNFAGAGFIEYAVREFGAERLVFGSFLPVNDPFVAMGMVLDAGISEQEKRLLAGDNLRRLIGEARL